MNTNACDNLLIELEAPDYGRISDLIQEVVEIVQPGFTITLTSILSPKEKENIELKKRIRKTNAAIVRTQRYIQHMLDMDIQTIENLYKF